MDAGENLYQANALYEVLGSIWKNRMATINLLATISKQYQIDCQVVPERHSFFVSPEQLYELWYHDYPPKCCNEPVTVTCWLASGQASSG